MAKQKRKLPKILLFTSLILLVLVVVGSKLGWFGKGEVVKVAIDKVIQKDVVELVSASGKIHPEVEVKLSSEVSGEVVELTVKEGDYIKKGQILCRIKPDILKSGYDRAIASLQAQRANLAAVQQQLIQQEASFKSIQATYTRNKQLFEKRVISAAEMEKSTAEYESTSAAIAAQRQNVNAAKFTIAQSQASVQEAGDNLARTTIYAPIDGVISLLSIELGERVVGTAQMAGTEIMRIANMNSMEVNVEVNENDINRVQVGNPATIEVDAFQARKFTGVVTEIASSSKSIGSSTSASSADQVTNFNVKVRIHPNSYEDILADKSVMSSPFRPGLSATAQIKTQQARGLVVPIQSVTVRADKDDLKDSVKLASSIHEYVFVTNGDEVKITKVKTGIQDEQHIIILSGLKAGEQVVSRPFDAITKTLQDKSKIEIVDKSSL